MSKTLSEEHKHRLSEAGKGRPKSPETRERMRIAALNRSPEEKEARRLALIERNKTGFNKGRTQTEEERQHHSEAIKKKIDDEGFKPWENFETTPEIRHEAAVKREAEKVAKRPWTKYGWKVEAKIRGIKRSAAQRKFAYSLPDDEARELIISQCHYCSRTPRLPNPAGIDRLDSGIGYVSGNCVPCCSRHNFMKMQMSEREFIQECVNVADHCRHRLDID